MDGSKLSLFMVFMVSAVAARLIPNGDVDKKHNSDDQELLDRQDYSPRRRFPKPAILTTGICVKSPSLPCCKQTIEVYEMLKKPGDIMDLSYPNCRSEGYYAGYYASKQCNWFMCYCVDPNGNSVEVTTQRPKYAWYYNYFDINCKDYAVEKPDLGNNEYEVEPADQLLTSEEISNLPDLPIKEDSKTAGMTIDELMGGGDDIVHHH